MSIGTKQGITYHCECNHLVSILSPTIDNDVKMRYTGFLDEMWDEYVTDFDAFGYGLKKTRENKGVILCDDASLCFESTKGYVGMVLSLPQKIQNGVYEPLSSGSNPINEYLLFGVNVGTMDATYPTISAKLTTSGIEFTIWTSYGQYTITDNTSNIYANNSTLYEFVWDAEPMDDFFMDDFDGRMSIRINREDTVIGNYPIGSMVLSGLNFCALDTPLNYYNFECTIRRLILANEIPEFVEDDWFSTTSSSSSGGFEGDYIYEDLTYEVMADDATINLVTYTNVGTESDILQLTGSTRRFKHLWLPNSSGGNTLSKIDITDTTHPVEVGRYKLANASDNPSRTVVVPPGDCWVASRTYGAVTKVGLTEASHCRDTCLNTSTGTNELAYGDDDAVLYYFDVQSESMKEPSTAPSGDIQVRGIADDVNGNIWVEAGINSGKIGTWYKISGDGGLTTGGISTYGSLSNVNSYGAVCSYSNNYIWSVRSQGTPGIDFFSADDPENTFGTFQYVLTYGIAYARGFVYTGDYNSTIDANTRRVVRIDARAGADPLNFPLYTTTFTFINCPTTLYFPRHFTVHANSDSAIDSDRTEDLYINWMGWGTNAYLGVIRNHKQYANGSNIEIDFNTTEKYQMGYKAVTGLGVMYDVENKPFIWILNSEGTNVQTFDIENKQLIDFYNGNDYLPLGKSAHYNYTNFTGTVDEAGVIPISGTSIYVIDGFESKWWKKVCLTLTVPAGSTFQLSASASADPNVFEKAVNFNNCEDISNLNFNGRYLRIIFQFNRASQSDPSPKVTDMEVQFNTVVE